MATVSNHLRRGRAGRSAAGISSQTWTALSRTGTRHGFPALSLVFLVLTAFGSAIFVRPFELDNVVALSWADRSNPLQFFSKPVEWTYADTGGTVPIYRPLAYLSIWFQEKVASFHATQYFVVNLGLWIAAALALYSLVYVVTRSRVSAVLAAGVFAVDDRALTAIVWIAERQSVMACLFGLSALVLVARYGGTQRRRSLAAGVFLLLLLAAFSKEYGLAFVAAAPLLAIAHRSPQWKAIAAASAGAVLVYVAFRWGLAGGATGSYCEDMGLFRRHRRVCYDDLALGARLEQQAYNVVASLVGTIFPQLFSGDGAWQRGPARSFVVPFVVAVLAALGAVRKPRTALPLLSLILANAVLSFLVYRTRNQLIGMAGLYGAAGIGASALVAVARMRLREWLVPASAAVLLVALGWIAWRAERTDFRQVESYRALSASIDPCTYLEQYPRNIRRAVLVRIKTTYGLSDPSCSRA